MKAFQSFHFQTWCVMPLDKYFLTHKYIHNTTLVKIHENPLVPLTFLLWIIRFSFCKKIFLVICSNSHIHYILKHGKNTPWMAFLVHSIKPTPSSRSWDPCARFIIEQFETSNECEMTKGLVHMWCNSLVESNDWPPLDKVQ